MLTAYECMHCPVRLTLPSKVAPTPPALAPLCFVESSAASALEPLITANERPSILLSRENWCSRARKNLVLNSAAASFRPTETILQRADLLCSQDQLGVRLLRLMTNRVSARNQNHWTLKWTARNINVGTALALLQDQTIDDVRAAGSFACLLRRDKSKFPDIIDSPKAPQTKCMTVNDLRLALRAAGLRTWGNKDNLRSTAGAAARGSDRQSRRRRFPLRF